MTRDGAAWGERSGGARASRSRNRLPYTGASMPDDLASRFDLPVPDQLGYVVEDLERALPHYEALFGPFRMSDSALQGVTFRGRQVDCRLRIAVNDSGPWEIELIQVLGGETPHTEHLARHGEGLHHVRFRVKGLEERCAALQAAGFETIFYKRFEGAGNLAFAYLAAPAERGGSVIELLEMG